MVKLKTNYVTPNISVVTLRMHNCIASSTFQINNPGTLVEGETYEL